MNISSCRCIKRTCRALLSDRGGVNTLVEGRSVVVDVQHVDGHINRPLHYYVVVVQCLDLDADATVSSTTPDNCCNSEEGCNHVTVIT